MQASLETAALLRSLLSLARSRATGTLAIRAPGGCCSLALVDGRLAAAIGGRDTLLLGDWLLQRGELDTAAHAAALQQAAPDAPIGIWLAQRGIATSAAIERALRDQTRDRVATALRWAAPQFHFERDPAQLGVPWLDSPLELRELVWAHARQALPQTLWQDWLERHAHSRVVCSPFGVQLLHDAEFTVGRERLTQRLLQGGPLAQLCSDCSATELEWLAALCWMSALRVTQPASQIYALLLRKRSQLRRNACATELLEISPDAKADEARRALRRLASRVHPDLLGPSAPHALRELSGEVMRALLEAEGSWRFATLRR